MTSGTADALIRTYAVLRANATRAGKAAATFPNTPGNGDFLGIAQELGTASEEVASLLQAHGFAQCPNTGVWGGQQDQAGSQSEIGTARILEVATIIQRLAAGPRSGLTAILFTDAEFGPERGPRPCGDEHQTVSESNVFHVQIEQTGHVLTFVADEACDLRYSILAGVRFPDGSLANSKTTPNWYVGEGIGDRTAVGISDMVFPDALKEHLADSIRATQTQQQNGGDSRRKAPRR